MATIKITSFCILLCLIGQLVHVNSLVFGTAGNINGKRDEMRREDMANRRVSNVAFT